MPLTPLTRRRYLSTAMAAGDSSARARLELVVRVLITDGCDSFRDCVKWARTLFEVHATVLLARSLPPPPFSPPPGNRPTWLSSLRASDMFSQPCSSEVAALKKAHGKDVSRLTALPSTAPLHFVTAAFNGSSTFSFTGDLESSVLHAACHAAPRSQVRGLKVHLDSKHGSSDENKMALSSQQLIPQNSSGPQQPLGTL